MLPDTGKSGIIKVCVCKPKSSLKIEAACGGSQPAA
jgi:hypothetical protein